MTTLAPIREWESKSALLAHLDTGNRRSFVLGRDAEAPRAYYSFVVASCKEPFEIGVITSGHGVSPEAVLLDNPRRVLVGHDVRVSYVDIEPLSIASALELNGVFYSFLPVDRDDEIVILHELGVLRATASGSVKWSVDTDVVEESSVDSSGNLHLKVMDGPGLVVSLTSGEVSR